MKILYAVQATGNGHISRASELMPYLKLFGEVDVFLSGSNSQLETSLPVKFRSKGLSLFYNRHGGLDIVKTMYHTNLLRIYREAKALPLEQYDAILNDFECITALACRIKRRPGLHFGHQASFVSPLVPRPKFKNPAGEWILKHYASSTKTLGLHFKPYDQQIVSPVIRHDVLEATPEDDGSVVVYLPQYDAESIIKTASEWDVPKVYIFSGKEPAKNINSRITRLPVSQKGFGEAMIRCHLLISGAGFETPAEALYLKKKLVVIPIQGQYEQLCNAEALKEWNVKVYQKIEELTRLELERIMHEKQTVSFSLQQSTAEIASIAVQSALAL